MEYAVNPIILAGLGIIAAGTFSEIHTTSISAGFIFLLVAIDKTKADQIVLLYTILLLSTILISLIYYYLGLSGAGFAKIV